MSIRDIVLTLIVFGSLPLSLLRPYIGVFIWTWLSFMNPHRLTWGFAYFIPFAQIVAVPTLLGLLFTSDRRSIPAVRESLLLTAFWAITALSTISAMYPEEAWPDLIQFSKILLMTFVTIALIRDRRKLRYLLIIVALSLGFYGFKGGIWGLVTGGASGWVLGPEETFIGDNNGLALGLNMALPIIYYLAREEPKRWFRILLFAVFFLSIIAVLLTYSRSGFLGLLVVLLALVARSKWKVPAMAAVFAIAITLAPILSDRWFKRMNSISEYEQDSSAMSRLYAWSLGWQLALDKPILGGGFRVFPHPEIWQRYVPEYFNKVGQTHNAHSIYFHVLGEHGFIAFILYMSLMVAILQSLRHVRRDAKILTDGAWLMNYSVMVEASVAAFLVTGAFQNLSYFDLFYLLVAVTVILKQLTKEAIMEMKESEVTSSLPQWENFRTGAYGKVVANPSVASD